MMIMMMMHPLNPIKALNSMEWFQPKMRKLTSGCQNSPLKGLNLRYMYCGQKQFYELIDIYQYEQQKMVLILICFDFYYFWFQSKIYVP